MFADIVYIWTYVQSDEQAWHDTARCSFSFKWLDPACLDGNDKQIALTNLLFNEKPS